MLEVVLKRQAQRRLRRLPGRDARAVVAALRQLAEDPERGNLDVVPIVNSPYLRLRVRDWRVFFHIDGPTDR